MNDSWPAVRGELRFGADVGPPEAAHLVFVRSAAAHAAIVDIDTTAAAALPGVRGVFTASDLDLPPYCQIPGVDPELAQPPLALDEVRFVGQRIAAVVADSLARAYDAAELVDVVLQVREPVLDHRRSEQTVGRWDIGTAHQPAADDVSITLDVHNPRLAPSPIETTTVVAEPRSDGGLLVHAGAQLPAATHQDLSRDLGLAPERVRLIGPPMGGAFGAKTVGASPDLTVTAACALRLGHPVRLVEDRSSHLAVNHARDQHQTWTLVAGPGGELRHIALDATADGGAYVATGAMEPATTALMAAGCYRIESVHVQARAVLTNTAPTGPYRGPGRAEATAGLERAMDRLAAELDIDPIELRRRNLLRADDYPYTSACGAIYDAADPESTLDAALTEVGYVRWSRERSERRTTNGPFIGIGVSTWVDATGGYSAHQQSSLCVRPDGALSLAAGAAPSGQGHAVTFASQIAERLGLATEDVHLAAPDSDADIEFIGSFGSRSGQVVASSVDDAVSRFIDEARALAARHLEASVDDVVLMEGGRFGVAGVPRSALNLAELEQVGRADRPPADDTRSGLVAIGHFAQEQRTFPSGCHVAVVAVEPDTGAVKLQELVGVTDCGTIIHEVSAIGQAQGAMAQGAAQALFEEITYDSDGNLLTGTFTGYAVPAASEFPPLRVQFRPTPTDRNPLGAKGLGESGTVGAPAAVHNAVIDAVAHLGVQHIEMPCTPERVWTAITAAGG
ncbi:MAG: xanthine dehydrogenase family protein molybdopterin-binding subunit [Acidimicrobiales bacterium]